ncbi:MAG TPA: hypothetical protein VEC01_16050 [Noviherbaspirillum sp.]|uniref:hypothetical protein n=1 Tax=Noviherbaspirillum sp. TaxID=1926288 RepID=UPI002D43ED59|nr:hypothetical protein [Noviherbaspirillum sp.]HYD96843.1 hypothetical protein [Noviherbaspirillum sp.]
MHALDLRDNALQWESERQNRIHQDALEQKKKQMRLEAVRRDAPAERAPAAPPLPLEELIDKVYRIPDMRSALMPLDDDAETWSKPFSLAKADMEPWLSFYKGYRQSRLFLEGAGAVAESGMPALDFPVQALLELRQVNVRLIVEPPVQINGQVEYLDVEGELANSNDPAHVRALLRTAVLAHDQQLGVAVEKGRAMGDLLHDALLGEGHVHLIKAWERVYRRKPTVEELHRMLTTGRTQPPVEKKAAANEIRQRPAPTTPPAIEPRPRPAPPQAAVAAPASPRKQPAPLPQPVIPELDDDDDDEAIVTLGKAAGKPAQRGRRIAWHLAHAALGCAALAAYLFLY